MTLLQKILLGAAILLGSAIAGRMGSGNLLGCCPDPCSPECPAPASGPRKWLKGAGFRVE